jgi:cytochrome c-type biogenesis protein
LSLVIVSINLVISELAQKGNLLMQQGLNHPGPFTVFLVFSAGLLTSLGPCSLSLLPVTIAYIGGTEKNQFKLLSFSGGVVFALVILGALSGFLGKIYGQIPPYYTSIVAVIAIIMGFNLLGFLRFQLPNGPDLKFVEDKIPSLLKPFAIGTTFGLASSPCITPVLASLLAWVSQAKNPTISIIFLFFFGLGQVIPIIIAGATTENLKQFLELRKYSQVIPKLSGIFLVSLGGLNLLSNWI